MSEWPSERGRTIIEVRKSADYPTFISAADGLIHMIYEIESDLRDGWRGCDDMGDGSYLFKVQWESPQIGPDGRIELPGYWDLTLLQFKPEKL